MIISHNHLPLFPQHKRRNSRKATEERKTEGERALKENSDKLLKRMSDFHCPGQRDEGLDKVRDDIYDEIKCQNLRENLQNAQGCMFD